MKVGMYADGDYENTCCTCKERFVGDKRAVQCLSCAVGKANKEMGKLRRLKHNIETVFKLHSSSVDPDHKQICIQVQELLRR